MDKITERKNNSIWIIIPAFNEETIIEKVLTDIQLAGYRNIIVVDDGSIDGTYKKALKSGVYVIKHYINRGKGAATQTGFEAAKQLNADIAVTIDADGQHEPKEISQVIKPLIEKNYDVSLGSRFLTKNTQMPLIKKLINQLGNILVYLMYGIYVTDSQSGFRAYSKHALGVLNTSMDRYEFETEVIKLIQKFNLKFTEVPISVNYTNYSKTKYNDVSLPNFTSQKVSNSLKMLIRLIITSITK